MNPSVPIFTAAQIATATGRKRQNVARELANLPHDGMVLSGGNQTRAWAFLSLPLELRSTLDAEAVKRGCRTAEALLSQPALRWEPRLPLGKVAQEWLDKAAKLQSALATALRRQHEDGMTAAALDTLGLADYKTAFGFEISAKHWRTLFHRTVQRDGGAEAWSRLDIYLDEAAGEAKAEPLPPTRRDLEDFADVLGRIHGFADKACPTAEETALLWDTVCETWHNMPQDRPGKERFLAFLMQHSPSLARNRNALRVAFNRKYPAWAKGGFNLLLDGRSANGGHQRLELTQEQKDEMTYKAAIVYEGALAPAFRDMREEGKLPQLDGRAYARKSHVPDSARGDLRVDVRLGAAVRQGPRSYAQKAWVERDWDGVHARDWYQADDCTAPVYYREPDGFGGFTILRGQWLVMIDLRSCRVLSWVLISEPQYDSMTIRALMNRTMHAHGLPRRGFYFERGIWQSSHLVKGGNPHLSDAETETGFKKLGIEFKHAIRPSTKIVERVLGALQDLMAGELGYAGRSEMLAAQERMRREKHLVESGKLNPDGAFYTRDQYVCRLETLVAKYNAAPQEGKMLKGMSPDEAFERLDDPTNPTMRMDARTLHLVSRYVSKIKVTENGVRIQIGKRAFQYRAPEFGKLVGTSVMVGFDPDIPENASVTDLAGENHFMATLATAVPAIDASPEVMGKAMAEINGQLAHGRKVFKMMDARHKVEFRKNLVDMRTAEMGQMITEQTAAQKARQQEASGRMRKAQRLAKVTGFDEAQIARDDHSVAAAARLAEFHASHSQGNLLDDEL